LNWSIFYLPNVGIHPSIPVLVLKGRWHVARGASMGVAPCEPEILLVSRPFVTMLEVDSPLALPTYAVKVP
jgi:hypothetical protein